MATGQRTPEQIRASIETNRRELGNAIERLQGEVKELTDWRRKVAENQRQILIGAAVAGFLIGGGIAGVTGIFRRRR
jgi:3-dehydroquinate dehydratase